MGAAARRRALGDDPKKDAQHPLNRMRREENEKMRAERPKLMTLAKARQGLRQALQEQAMAARQEARKRMMEMELRKLQLSADEELMEKESAG